MFTCFRTRTVKLRTFSRERLQEHLKAKALQLSGASASYNLVLERLKEHRGHLAAGSFASLVASGFNFLDSEWGAAFLND